MEVENTLNAKKEYSKSSDKDRKQLNYLYEKIQQKKIFDDFSFMSSPDVNI